MIVNLKLQKRVHPSNLTIRTLLKLIDTIKTALVGFEYGRLYMLHPQHNRSKYLKLAKGILIPPAFGRHHQARNCFNNKVITS